MNMLDALKLTGIVSLYSGLLLFFIQFVMKRFVEQMTKELNANEKRSIDREIAMKDRYEERHRTLEEKYELKFQNLSQKLDMAVELVRVENRRGN